MLGDGWHTVGFWLAHCWFMVGRMLLYGWRFMLGQRVSNEQSNVGLTKYVAVGPTLNQRLGFGWRMVIVLAGTWLRAAPLRFTYESLTGTFLATPHAERAVVIGWQ